MIPILKGAMDLVETITGNELSFIAGLDYVRIAKGMKRRCVSSLLTKAVSSTMGSAGFPMRWWS